MKALNLKNILLFVALLAVSLNTQAKKNTWESKLTVIITGIKNKEGDLKISLQNKPKIFNTDEGLKKGRGKVLDITGGTAQYSFNKLHHGEYALAIFHDQNKNDLLDLDLFDSPTEGYGFSNNPKVINRAPLFKESSFSFRANKTVRVELRYPD